MAVTDTPKAVPAVWVPGLATLKLTAVAPPLTVKMPVVSVKEPWVAVTLVEARAVVERHGGRGRRRR